MPKGTAEPRTRRGKKPCKKSVGGPWGVRRDSAERTVAKRPLQILPEGRDADKKVKRIQF